MNGSWVFLLVAGLCEIGWPLGLKLANIYPQLRLVWFAFSFISIVSSGVCLFFAQRIIPIGTAYAIWTGIGAAGTFIVGILGFNDPVSVLRILSVLFIIAGIIGLKLSSA